jgi:hypothetical protein
MRSDEQTAGLVVEGWAFDPTRTGEAARLTAGAREGIRTRRTTPEEESGHD